jgi:Protein of unknown function (DUF3135)
MQNLNNTDFDFDNWAKLAKEDPDAFEIQREKMIQELIESTSPDFRKRMQGLQWQIDQIRSTSSNPMASCLKISQMMWDNVLGEDGLLEHMQQLSNPDDIPKIKKTRESATVINISDNDNKEKS